MAVRLSDIRNGRKPDEENKSTGVRLSDIRQTRQTEQEEVTRKAEVKKKAEYDNNTKILNNAGMSLLDRTQNLDLYGGMVTDTVTPKKEAKKVAKPVGPNGEELKPREPYWDRVKDRVKDFPSIVQPLVAPIAALEQLPAMLATSERLGGEKPIEQGYLPVSGGGKVAGDILAPLSQMGGAQGAGLLTGRIYQSAGNVLNRIAPQLSNSVGGRIASSVIKGTPESTLQSVGGTLAINPQASNEELKDAAVYGAGFGLVPGVGRGLKEVADYGKRGVSETLGNATGALSKANNAPQYAGNLRLNNQQQNLTRVRASLADEVSEAMTPPLENEKLLRAWVKPHLGNPSNSEMAKFSYEDLRQLAEEIRTTLNQTDIERNIAKSRGIDLSRAMDEAPSLRTQVNKDATKRTFGDNPTNLPPVSKPLVNQPSPRPVAPVGAPVTSAVPETPARPVTVRQAREAQQGTSKSDPTTFKTSKGSSYDVDANGNTTRTKSQHDGHDPTDVGLKTPSERTVYVDKDQASRIGDHGALNSASKSRIVIRDDGLYLVSWNTKENRWGKHGEKISYTTNPEVGKSPIEFWKVGDEAGLGTVSTKYHAGNDIIEVGGTRTVTPENTVVADSTTTPAPIRQGEQPMQERGFATTLRESDKTPQSFKDQLKSAYKPIRNEETLAHANKRINKDVEEATSFVLGGSRFSPEKATTAQRLIDHYNQAGNFQRAVDIAEKVSEEATKAGQSIQALSMFNNLTPEGILIRAQRLATKTNESLPVGRKEVKVTPEMAEDIVGLAQVSQKMTGVKDLANNIENILDKAKAGTKLTDTETADLKRFVNESRQFIKEVSKAPKAPKAPQMPKDSRVKDNVVKFLDAQEQAAKERLKARGIRMSSTPLDVWADYAIIGAAKMGKGTIKFAEWSKQMVDEFGDSIKPHLNHLYEESRKAFNISSKKVTSQTISDAERLVEQVIKTKELAPGPAVTLRRLAQNVSRLSGEEKNLASQDLQEIMHTLNKPTFLRKVATTQTIGQLLNPKTQVRNSLGNELFYRLERLNKYIATPIDVARSKITGGERTVTFRTNNQGQYWHNWMRGLKAGWRRTNVNGIETQYDLGGPSFKSKYNPMTYLEKALGASLKSFDTAAYMRAYNNTLGEQATLRALNEGQKGNKELIKKYIREADDNLIKMADEYGKYSTFQDNNSISNALVALKKGLNLKKDFGLGDLIIKYPKTPGALLHRALEYSPAGFVRSAAILARPLLKKTPNTGEAMNALSRAIVGTAGLTGMGFFLLDKGVLTGSVSKDKDIRELQKSTGQGQYQVNLSALIRLVKSGFDADSAKLQEDDYLYTYDWMQPVSMAVSVGANTAKNFNAGEQKLSGLAGTAYNSLEGGLGTLTEQSVVQGLKRAAEGYPGQTITDKVIDVLSDIPASFVPTFSNQIKQMGDNNKPETYDPSKLRTSLNRAQAKVPGLAQKLPIQYDALGRKKEVYQNNNLFNVMFNPGFSSRFKLTPEEEYILDLIEESGDESLAPRVPGKKITVKGESIVLNGDMFSRLQQLQGEETREMVEKRMNRDGSKRLETRVKNVTGGLTDAGSKARKQLLKEMKP